MAEPASLPEEKVNLSAIAKEFFGNEFYGEVEETAPEPPIEEGEEPIEAEAAEPADETNETEEPKEEETVISSVDELIAQQEWDAEWFNSLSVPVKIDGEVAKAKISDMVASYQTQEAANKRLVEAKEKAKVQNQALAEKGEQLKSQFAAVAGILEQSEKLLTADIAKIDWEALRQQDPAEWSAKRQDFAERKAQIDQLKAGAVAEYQKHNHLSKAEQDESKRAVLLQEHERLLEKIPAWKDAKVRETETKKVSNYLLNQGLSQEEIAEASDHRLVNLAYKAMLFDESMAKVDTAKKKVVTIPKMMKSGTVKPPDQINQEKRAKLMDKLRKTGSEEVAMQLLGL